MFRSVTTFALMTVLISSALADEADKPKLGKVIYPDAIRFVSNTSEDRAVVTMLFDNFVLATSDGKGDLLESHTKSFSIANKVEAKDSVSVTLDIRGFVSTQEGGSAALIVQAGGKTTLVDLSKAIEAATSNPRNAEDSVYAGAKESSKVAGFSVNSRPKKSDGFFVRIPATLQKNQPLQATVLLLVDRLPDTGSAAVIMVDSIDVTVSAETAPKKLDDGEKPTPKKTGERKSANKKSSDE